MKCKYHSISHSKRGSKLSLDHSSGVEESTCLTTPPAPTASERSERTQLLSVVWRKPDCPQLLVKLVITGVFCVKVRALLLICRLRWLRLGTYLLMD